MTDMTSSSNQAANSSRIVWAPGAWFTCQNAKVHGIASFQNAFVLIEFQLIFTIYLSKFQIKTMEKASESS
jgi:hypothetical protein